MKANPVGWLAAGSLLLGVAVPCARAAERVTLRNGFDLTCDHRVTVGDKVRLYMERGSDSFVEVAATEISASETVADPEPEVVAAAGNPAAVAVESKAVLTPEEMREMLSKAGAKHNVDVDLLASVVRAESGGHVRAVSRAGAQGLMQLMPGTAAELGVGNTFVPEQNVDGGSAYLDGLLTRYHDNLALALAAYNAGPAAVDRWHGIPPYRETRLYVARVIREFNARVKTAEHRQGPVMLTAASAHPGAKGTAMQATAERAAHPGKDASNPGRNTQLAAANGSEGVQRSQRP